jgi:hypothetical protein
MKPSTTDTLYLQDFDREEGDQLYSDAIKAYKAYCDRQGYAYQYPSKAMTEIEDNTVILYNSNGRLYEFHRRKK